MKEGGYDESFYDDLLNIELNVPCNSWDDEVYCLKCFGLTWREQNVLGIVKKIKYNRRTSEPRFEIFPNKRETKNSQAII